MDIFNQYPNLEKYYKTSDGQKFFREEHAISYAQTLTDKRVTEVYRVDAESAKEGSAQKVEDILHKLPEMELEEVKALLEREESYKKPRKNLLEAFKNRISELENSQN